MSASLSKPGWDPTPRPSDLPTLVPHTQHEMGMEHASNLPGWGPTSMWGSVVQGYREKQQELTQNCRKVMSLPLPAHAHGHYFKSNETTH